MRPILILVLLTTAPSLFGSIPGRELRLYEDPSHTRALEYLDQAHTLSGNFSIEERGWTVLDAADVAAPIDPDRGNRWSLEVWEIAKQLSRGQSRIALQKNALRELALNDPNGALRLCKQEDLPSSWDAVLNVTEDSRSLGYVNIFFKPVWEKGGMPYRAKLENVARFFGQTGQYPYATMSHIAVDIAPGDPAKVSRILRDATRYFQRDPGFITTNQEFVRFILATRKIASPKILRKELMVATTALQQQPRTFKNRTYRVSITTPRGTAAFGSQNEALLFQLLPVMKISVPKIAAELLERYPSLRLAPEITVDTPIAYAGSVSLGGTADPARMQSALDEGRAFKVQMMAASDPATALSIAQQITDSTLRDLAQVSLVPAYAKEHPEQANAWLADAQSILLSISDAGKKLRLMSAVALAQIKLGKYSEATPWIAQVFALAEDLFMRERRENPAEPSYALTGYDELSDLTENLSETEAQQSSLIARIETVSDEVLRARLLTVFAKGALHESALHHVN